MSDIKCTRLVEMDLEHSAALSGAITALRQDEQTRLNDVIAKTRAEEEVELIFSIVSSSWGRRNNCFFYRKSVVRS